jgi:hypothetical protein
VRFVNDIVGHSTANSAIHYVQRTTQDYREAMKRYPLSTPLGGSKRITAAQKVYVGRTRNRTRAVSSLLAVQQKVCKTSTPQFDPGPRLQVPWEEAFTRMQALLRQRSAEPFASYGRDHLDQSIEQVSAAVKEAGQGREDTNWKVSAAHAM